ncbi:MAG: hypothetical protein Q4F69_06165 [Bacteroidia bacterium]|nr:hypothetical protein [Bacteroidia bacterium]
MGIFINDRAWNLKKAKENYDWAAWHSDRAAKALRRNDFKAAKDHADRAKIYKDKGDEYTRDAAKCTK